MCTSSGKGRVASNNQKEPFLGVEAPELFGGKDFPDPDEFLKVPVNNLVLDDAGNRIGSFNAILFQSG